MASARAHAVARLGRCICAAALLVAAAPASGMAQQSGASSTAAAGAAAPAHDAAHDAGQSPPRGATAPPDQPSRLGTADVHDARVVPAAPRAPRMSARDRLFALMRAIRPKPPGRPRPPGLATPSAPMRNAIGIRIDPPATARPATMAHWGQRPGHLATVGTTTMAAPASAPNAWHPALAARPPGTRVGSGTAVIGGPAKTVTGINGTTLRRKHQ